MKERLINADRHQCEATQSLSNDRRKFISFSLAVTTKEEFFSSQQDRHIPEQKGHEKKENHQLQWIFFDLIQNSKR